MSAHLRNHTCTIISEILRMAKIVTCSGSASPKAPPLRFDILFNLIVNEVAAVPHLAKGWFPWRAAVMKSRPQSLTMNGIRERASTGRPTFPEHIR